MGVGLGLGFGDGVRATGTADVAGLTAARTAAHRHDTTRTSVYTWPATWPAIAVA